VSTNKPKEPQDKPPESRRPVTAAKPHRRVLLTQPSITNAEESLLPEPGHATFTEEEDQTRMTVFLHQHEVAKLEEVWVQMRLSLARPSKGDIVRAAMAIAFEDREQLEREILKRKGIPFPEQKSDL
jgi:hypothetical protein